jgi:hypothetical protein
MDWKFNCFYHFILFSLLICSLYLFYSSNSITLFIHEEISYEGLTHSKNMILIQIFHIITSNNLLPKSSSVACYKSIPI